MVLGNDEALIFFKDGCTYSTAQGQMIIHEVLI